MYEPQTTSNPPASSAATRVIPLLQALNRAEELAGALVLRLDPITVHETVAQSGPDRPSNNTTVTNRINQVGDALQYLLDNIEL